MDQQFFSFAHNKNLTPMMKQYFDIKLEYQNAILFYRMGDFYEMFFEDAKLSSPILGITLTSRGQQDGEAIPMCGVPFHSCESYIAKLIYHGHKVAICEQMESPEEAKKRGYKSVVRREVVRVITPGTITEDHLLAGNSANYLVAIASYKENLSLAWGDISTGDFFYSQTNLTSLASDLTRINPKEILISDKLLQNEDIKNSLQDYRRNISILANSLFDLKKAEHKINKYYELVSSEVFGNLLPEEIIACGVIIEYIELTQKSQQNFLNQPKKISNNFFMSIDSSTRKNLELNFSLNGEKHGSLFHLINKTTTSCGLRLLNQYLSTPLIDCDAINKRLDLIEFFLTNKDLSSNIASSLNFFADVERSLARLHFNRGGPRDLAVFKQSIYAADLIAQAFLNFEGKLPVNLSSSINNLVGFDALFLKLDQALTDSLPVLARDGNFIKNGFDANLDRLRDLKNNSQQKLQDLKDKYILDTGINSLKINCNNVLGFFIDITPQHANKVKVDYYIHRQTLANSVRYTTIELRELENELNNLDNNLTKLELQIFSELVEAVLAQSSRISMLAHSIATIDVAVGLSYLAIEQNYCRPCIDNSREFNIKNGRHPVIERSLIQDKKEFIANDCDLNIANNLWLITGPNMAGKSTFLRQNALLAILGQIGSYVPADSAYFGVIDKVYSRVGAGDDLARGRSTFMVEMIETANILNNATDRSLIILDEIGRGTSTHDGVSIASACLEYIHNNIKARAIFATHYHELTHMNANLTRLSCHTMQIKEWQNKIIFMHKIINGSVDKSYGIHVANLAGIPNEVIVRAEEILLDLERNKISQIVKKEEDFTNKKTNELEKFVANLQTDELTPKQALEILYKLKTLI